MVEKTREKNRQKEGGDKQSPHIKTRKGRCYDNYKFSVGTHMNRHVLVVRTYMYVYSYVYTI